MQLKLFLFKITKLSLLGKNKTTFYLNVILKINSKKKLKLKINKIIKFSNKIIYKYIKKIVVGF